MKKLFTVMGVIFAFLMVAGVAGFFVLSYFGSGLDEESKSYVDTNLPIIISEWKVDEFIDRASPEIMQVAPKEKVEELFHVCAERLGPLKEYGGSQGESKIVVTNRKGKVITGTYIAKATFEKAPATIQFRIIKHDNNWQILEFRVNSEAMMP